MRTLPFYWLLITLGAPVSALLAQEARLAVPAEAKLPAWTNASSHELGAGTLHLKSGELELLHSAHTLGDFSIRVRNEPFASGQDHPQIGYLQEGRLCWLDLESAADHQCNVQGSSGVISVSYSCKDPEGATWRIAQEFRQGSMTNLVEIHTRVSVDQERAVAFVPMLMVFPGANSFGSAKGQGLLAGLEYLENEPSSSEADLIGPASRRQVPDNLKITFPLMVIQHEGRYLGLIWQMRPQFSAVFDSPDRRFHSGGHVMGLLFPGSNGRNRVEGSLLPRSAELLHPNQPIVLNALLIGGLGNSVVPAIARYVQLRGLPAEPLKGLDFGQYAAQAAGGWLDSKIREGALIRHAIANGGFKAQPAADAAVWMDWLASRAPDSKLAVRLNEVAKEVVTAVPGGELNSAAVGHIRYPVPALVYGNVAENAARAGQRGGEILERLQKADYAVIYEPKAGATDYGKTHFSREATGLTSAVVLELLEAAAFSGDSRLKEEGLKALRAMSKFHDGVPRGAQTWECPLHTPDVLAAAHLVRAYTLGYALTGEQDFLDQARYWAWTGVPFVYLVNPTDRPVGLYSTIAVFGATQWRAPVWLGLPVQWCGLVYAEALYRLARYDPAGPWERLARGITASGIQQSWPSDNPELQGLLPDSFVLREQKRNGPAINPATVQACAVRYFGEKPVYDFWCVAGQRVCVHSPGAILDRKNIGTALSFRVDPWLDRPYYILVNGLARSPQLQIDGKSVETKDPHQFVESAGQLILKLNGGHEVHLAL